MRQGVALASRLAYEWGQRLPEGAVQTLEAQRTRAVALLAAVILTAGIVASATPQRSTLGDLGGVAALGSVLLVVGTLAVVACAVVVAWPITYPTLLDPSQIIKNYVEPEHEGMTPAWVHETLAKDLNDEYASLAWTMKIRNAFYKFALASVPAVIAGACLVWFDGRF